MQQQLATMYAPEADNPPATVSTVESNVNVKLHIDLLYNTHLLTDEEINLSLKLITKQWPSVATPDCLLKCKF